MSEYIQNGTSLYKKAEPNKRVDYKTDIDEFEFKRTPETDAMLKQICVRAIKLASSIVRCKDCKWFNTTYYKDTQICERHAYEIIMKPDDFCSKGEKKDN